MYELLSVQDNEHTHFSCEVKYSAEQRIQLHNILLKQSLWKKIKNTLALQCYVNQHYRKW
jgi:hypothetical protein